MCISFLGYDREALTVEEKLGFSEEGLLCMVSEISNENIGHLKTEFNLNCSLGQFFVSTGFCEQVKLHGPFDNIQEAFSFAEQRLGVVSFRTYLDSFE